MSGRRKKLLVADLLCGAGGSSTGCARALAALGLGRRFARRAATMTRAEAIAANRPRGHYVPAAEASLLLAQGWALLDDCPPPFGVKGPIADEVLLAPPRREEAA